MSSQITRIAVFGSTGSIGKSCLDIVRKFPQRFKVQSLVANKNSELLIEQIKEFKPLYAGLADRESSRLLKSQLGSLDVKIIEGEEISDLAGFDDYDLLMAAIVGFAGLKSVLNAAKAGKKIALANKESLVAAGELVLETVNKNQAQLIPVDSEHSAVFQLLQGRDFSEIEDITLTASGGPFFTRDLKSFSSITPAEAIKHPRWSMGNKISLDSATMFNKGLELIEACWLFGLAPEKIGIVIHPQSIVHALINFKDGCSMAHLSDTDMRGAISFAMNFPHGRLDGVLKKAELAKFETLSFHELDNQRFPAVEMARSIFGMGKAAGLVLNSANEVAGSAFMNGKITFPEIYQQVRDALSQFGSLNYSNYNDLLDIDRQVRLYLSKMVN